MELKYMVQQIGINIYFSTICCSYIITYFEIKELIMPNRSSFSSPENLSDDSNSTDINKNYWNYDSYEYFKWTSNYCSSKTLIAKDCNDNIIYGSITGQHHYNYIIDGKEKNITPTFYSPITTPISASSSYSITPDSSPDNPVTISEIDICDNIISRISAVYNSYLSLSNYIQKEYGEDTSIPIPAVCELKDIEHFQIFLSLFLSLLHNKIPWQDNNIPNVIIIRLIDLLECNSFSFCIIINI